MAVESVRTPIFLASQHIGRFNFHLEEALTQQVTKDITSTAAIKSEHGENEILSNKNEDSSKTLDGSPQAEIEIEPDKTDEPAAQIGLVEVEKESKGAVSAAVISGTVGAVAGAFITEILSIFNCACNNVIVTVLYVLSF